MLGVTLFVLALVGTSFGDDCCSAEDRKEIQSLWKNVWATANTDRKVTIVQALFDDLFSRHPEAKALFSGVKAGESDSGVYRAYCVRVATALDVAVNMLDEPDVLTKQVEYLASIHNMPGIKKEYMLTFAGSFERVFAKVSSCFDAAAWNRCFQKFVAGIANKM